MAVPNPPHHLQVCLEDLLVAGCVPGGVVLISALYLAVTYSSLLVTCPTTPILVERGFSRWLVLRTQ